MGPWLRSDNCVSTFRCGNTSVFLLSLGQGHDTASLEVHRFLHFSERPALAGFALKSLARLSPRQMVKAVGNAYAPPMIAAHLKPVLVILRKSGLVLQPSVLPLAAWIRCGYRVI